MRTPPEGWELRTEDASLTPEMESRPLSDDNGTAEEVLEWLN
jgi:hypothetical protein